MEQIKLTKSNNTYMKISINDVFWMISRLDKDDFKLDNDK